MCIRFCFLTMAICSTTYTPHPFFSCFACNIIIDLHSNTQLFRRVNSSFHIFFNVSDVISLDAVSIYFIFLLLLLSCSSPNILFTLLLCWKIAWNFYHSCGRFCFPHKPLSKIENCWKFCARFFTSLFVMLSFISVICSNYICS